MEPMPKLLLLLLAAAAGAKSSGSKGGTYVGGLYFLPAVPCS